MRVFSTFKEYNLHSKKEWLLSDDFIRFLNPFTYIILLIFLCFFTECVMKIKSYYMIPSIILLSYIIADIVAIAVHCFIIDGSYSPKNRKFIDDHLIVDTKTGYASCHHIFPSNWHDIPDSTLITTSFFLLLLPMLLLYYNLKTKYEIKFLLITTAIFICCIPLTHKYSHERLHDRDTPEFMKLLQNYGIVISPQKHQKHHVDNNYNWSLFSGHLDFIFDSIVSGICNIFNECPIEDVQESVEKLQIKDGDIIKIRFIGDIEGSITCMYKKGLFYDISIF